MTEQPTTTDSELQAALESARKKPSGNGNAAKGTLVLSGLVIAAAGFLGGYLVHGGDDGSPVAGGRPGFVQNGQSPGGEGRGPAGQAAGNITFGTVDDIQGSTITVKSQDGKSVRVEVGSDTDITVTKDGTITDLAKGDSIIVSGKDDDGTVSAKSITEGGMRLGQRAPSN